jgi:hypothetical protein
MKSSMLLAGIVFLSFLTISGARTRVIAPVPAPALTPPCTASMTTIPSCPSTGCGTLGDSLLNQAKNRFDAVTNPTRLTLDQIRAFSQPQSWDSGHSRDSIQVPGREGSAITVTGFLLKAKAEGKESCNCALSKRADTDIHLVLVSQLPDLDDQDEVDQAEMGSVTAEISPRVRRHGHATWLFKNINDFEGEYIRLTGRLMLDTKHIPQEHLLPDERRNRGLKRATNWEVHPVTRFQWCTKTKSQCDHGTGWKSF